MRAVRRGEGSGAPAELLATCSLHTLLLSLLPTGTPTRQPGKDEGTEEGRSRPHEVQGSPDGTHGASAYTTVKGHPRAHLAWSELPRVSQGAGAQALGTRPH